MIEIAKDPRTYLAKADGGFVRWDVFRHLVEAFARAHPSDALQRWSPLLENKVTRRSALLSIKTVAATTPLASHEIQSLLNREQLSLRGLSGDEEDDLRQTLIYLDPDFAVALARDLGLDCE